MKKPKPLTHPLVVPITPRLLAAIEAAAGRKVPPGCRVLLAPPPPPQAAPVAEKLDSPY